MTTTTIDRGGVEIICESRGAGPQILLLHAGGERRQVWRPVMNELDERGFRSVACDQRGHGASGGQSSDGIGAYAADTVAMIERIGGCPLVVGASLGGMASMLALADASTQADVSGLILVDVVPTPDPMRVRAFLARGGHGLDRSPLVDDILGRAAQMGEAAARLRMPLLLVRAGGVGAIDDKEVARLKSWAPQLQTIVIEETGHLIARDAPGELAKAIADFAQSDDVRDRRIDRFIARNGGAGLQHPGGTLGAHLGRVGDMLREWNEAPEIVDAGRLHAAYGTEGFASSVVADRGRKTVIGIIGQKAERLVHLYCLCDRGASYPGWTTSNPQMVDRHTGQVSALDDATRRALVVMTIANEMDVLSHDVGLAKAHGHDLMALFDSWRPHIGEQARMALDRWRPRV
ncbi:alpha/beta fold hydrolase, partial [Parvibaculum sp.]|uniref:alpha/beta fold hydrolase n=1 Tax=Parvibaculum sp. TaxID=2024848 RepID=UPI0034A04245